MLFVKTVRGLKKRWEWKP